MDNLKKFVGDLELGEIDASLSFIELNAGSLKNIDSESGIFESHIISVNNLIPVEKESAYVNYKSLNTFPDEVSLQKQEDVLNSLLLAQRAASKLYPEFEKSKEWYNKYFEVLENLGWVFQGNDFTKYVADKNIIEIEKVLIEILGTALTNNQLALILKTMNAFKELGENDKRFVVFEKQTHNLEKGSFQLGYSIEENNCVSLFVCGFVISSKKIINRIVFYSSRKMDLDIEYLLTKATLNNAIYSTIRDTVKDKLGNTNSYIANLNI